MKLFDDDEDPCPPKDDEARDRFEADMAEILAEEKRTECPAARALREAAANSVDSTLRAYRCQHTDDGDGGCVGLADALSPLADATIRRGLDEIRLLVDAVAGDIEAIPIPPCDAYERGRADALAETLDDSQCAVDRADVGEAMIDGWQTGAPDYPPGTCTRLLVQVGERTVREMWWLHAYEMDCFGCVDGECLYESHADADGWTFTWDGWHDIVVVDGGDEKLVPFDGEVRYWRPMPEPRR